MMKESKPAGREALVFLATVFTASWLIWAYAALASRHIIPAPVDIQILIVLGTITPCAASAVLTIRAEGFRGLKELFAPFLRWRFSGWLYAAALLARVVLLLLAFAGRSAIGLDLPPIGKVDVPFVLFYFPYELAGVGVGEETGWSGYLFGRLEQRLGAAKTELLLGVIWAMWHLPLFFIVGDSHFGRVFPVFALNLIAFRVLFMEAFRASGRSLLLVALFHTAYNVSTEITPYILDDILPVVLVWVVALLFLARRYREDKIASRPSR